MEKPDDGLYQIIDRTGYWLEIDSQGSVVVTSQATLKKKVCPLTLIPRYPLRHSIYSGMLRKLTVQEISP